MYVFGQQQLQSAWKYIFQLLYQSFSVLCKWYWPFIKMPFYVFHHVIHPYVKGTECVNDALWSQIIMTYECFKLNDALFHLHDSAKFYGGAVFQIHILLMLPLRYELTDNRLTPCEEREPHLQSFQVGAFPTGHWWKSVKVLLYLNRQCKDYAQTTFEFRCGELKCGFISSDHCGKRNVDYANEEMLPKNSL